jgi:hypothetical protein
VPKWLLVLENKMGSEFPLPVWFAFFVTDCEASLSNCCLAVPFSLLNVRSGFNTIRCVGKVKPQVLKTGQLFLDLPIFFISAPWKVALMHFAV